MAVNIEQMRQAQRREARRFTVLTLLVAVNLVLLGVVIGRFL